MPGNEVGDRIHNFFGQENLSQGQHHSQVVDGTWPGLNNNLWVGNQRQIGAPLTSNLKNYNVQQAADSDRGHGAQSSNLQQHGLNFTQSPLKPDLTRSQSQNQQPTLNGYMHGHQALQARQSESNFLGVDAEYNRHNLTLRGLPVLDSQLGNGPELNKKNSSRLESTESPVNYDFFGGQQQMSSQHPGMLQSLPRQQSGISDVQLLQQQVMFKKLQELQRQQQLTNPQFQQQESRQPSSIDQISSVMKQAVASHTSAHINGIPMQDTPNYSWQPELVGANTNWLQRGAPQVMQGSSGGLMFLPDQGQVRAMGLVPQQVDQSLYGVPITSTRTNPNQYSSIQMDKPTVQQISATSNSFPGNQYATFLEQGNMQDGAMVSRQVYQGKNMFGPDAGQGINSGLNFENMHQVNAQQRSVPMQEFHERQEIVGPSETSQEKTVMQVATSRSAATLDPEEEKILFGSDDSLWDAFGRSSNVGSGCSNMLDGTDFLGSFPTMQSGSWSALMQSAVAETSSGDTGQEGWNGLGVRSSEPPTAAQQASYVSDGNKQPSAWPENSLHAVSTMNQRPFPLSVDASTSVNYSSVSGVQQSGLKTSQDQSEKLQNDSSHKFHQKFSGEGSKWLDRGPQQKSVAEGGQFYGNVAPSSEAELNVKAVSASWSHQESISSYNTSGQPSNRPNGWKFIESVSPSGDATLRNQCNESPLQISQSVDYKSAMHEKMGHVTGTRKLDSASSATDYAKSAIGQPQVNREDTDLNNAAAISDSSTVRANHKSSQHLSNSHNLNFWKNADSSMNLRGSDVIGKGQDHDKNLHNIESPGNRGSDNGRIEHETENSHVKEKSGDAFRSNISHHTSTTGLRDNVWLDASDTHNLPGGKQKLSGHFGRKPSGTRKFQYHPMGDVDIDAEPSYGIKNPTHSHSAAQPVSRGFSGHEQAFLGQSKYFAGQIGKNSMETEKGRLPSLQEDTKYIEEVPSKSTHPGYVPVTSSPFENSVGNYAPNKTASSSQNMLELLHKVDQSKEHSPATHFSSSERNQSELPEGETSDGSIGHLQQNQSSSSQVFGLQLAPPSQRLSIPDHASSSQSSFQTVNSLSTSATLDMGKKDQTWLASTPSLQSLHPSGTTSQGDSRNNISGSPGQIGNKHPQYNVHGNFSTGFPHLRSHLHNQRMSGASGQTVLAQSANLSVDRFISHSRQQDDSCERTQTSQSALASVPDLSKVTPQAELGSSAETLQVSSNNQNHAKGSAQQFPILEAMAVSHPSVTPGVPQRGAFSKMLPNAWSTAPNQQTPSVAHGPSNLFKPHLQSTNNLERTFSGKQKLDDQIAHKGDSGPFGFSAYSAKPQGFVGNEQPPKEQQISPENDAGQKTMGASCLQGKESMVDHLSETSLSNSSTTQRDIEAFGRSLKPNNMLHQKYSLLHQMQAMKNTEIDPDNRSVKRFKGTDCVMDAQQVAPLGGQQLSYGSNNIIRDASTNGASLPPGDSNMLSFSSKSGNNRATNASPNDMLALDHADSHCLTINNSAVRGEHAQISPQMAPSWFDQYGTFKNGQMLTIYDSRRAVAMKAIEQPITVGKPSDSSHVGHSVQANAVPDASQLGNVQQSSSPMSQASGQHLSPQMPPVTTDQSLVLVRPKKRKTATSELLPWHREVMHGFRRLQNISMAEMEWAQAANRLMEKVEDETELIEDGPPMLRPRRRLILTTQLVQQLFHPPPAKLLSSDASSHYESVTYFIARSALGDACSSISSSRSDTSLHPDSGNPLPEKLKPSERIGHCYVTKATEEFINRAKKLEDDFLRVEKRASILDLRVECQDLEKFSVINRFAKFHGRGQAEGAETSSSSDAHTQKFFPQRYVTALPMPRNLPDRVQCLSL